MRNTGLTIVLSLLLMSCSSQSQENQTEKWKIDNYIDSVQILLTNEYQLNESFGNGASSFLIKTKKDTLLCTAKHLLGGAMGISPEIKTENFNSALVYWKSYPRNNKISNDTIHSIKLITEQDIDADIILQDCELRKENNIIALTPRFSIGRQGERFEIIGCEYSDSECHQRIFYATLVSYENGKMILYLHQVVLVGLLL